MNIVFNVLPLDVDFINENECNKPVLHSQTSLYSQSRFALYVLVECWIKAVYYYVNSKMLYQLGIFINCIIF